ncbi:MAG: hypothetical protein JNN28_10460 [Saprospiraceae bacterium]|nr:hypothetical protein [Saprospiraceae bacterium]
MKKHLLILPVFIGIIAFSSSCRKDPQEIIELITESEAAEIIEDAVADRTSGLTAPTFDAADIVTAYLNACGQPGDTTFSKSKTTGVATYNYVFGMDWLISCTDLGVPQSADINIEGNGNYSSPHWSGVQTTQGGLVFTGLSPQETAYVVNGNYDLDGNLTGTLRKVNPSIDCVISMELTNLLLDKTSQKITGGAGTFTLTASTANGQSKTLSGGLVFNGNNTVTVTVNGYEHTFEW